VSKVRRTSSASTRSWSSQVSLAVGVPRTRMDTGSAPSDTNALPQGSSKLVTRQFAPPGSRITVQVDPSTYQLVRLAH
jgi:hypothetical protein